MNKNRGNFSMNENLIGKKIMELREEKNLTQSELAEMLGVSDKMISKWECGETNPNLNLLPKIADCFNTNIDSLFNHRHSYKDDIIQTVFDYMQTLDHSEELNTLRNIMFWGLYGLGHKYCILYNGKEVAEEIMRECPIPDTLGRPTTHTDFHGYVKSYENKTLNMQVINLRPDDNFKAVFEKYDDYKSVFETLAIPNAGKILKYLYTDTSPQECTLKYISEQTGADEETVEKIVNLMQPWITEAVINGEKTKIYQIFPSEEILTLISVLYGYTTDWRGNFGDTHPVDVNGKKAQGKIIKGDE